MKVLKEKKEITLALTSKSKRKRFHGCFFIFIFQKKLIFKNN